VKITNQDKFRIPRFSRKAQMGTMKEKWQKELGNKVRSLNDPRVRSCRSG
jgi:hypothetical protein